MTDEEWRESDEGKASIERATAPIKQGGSDVKESQATKEWRESDEGKASIERATRQMPFAPASIRDIQSIQQKQAETGRIFTSPQAKETTPSRRAPEKAQPKKQPTDELVRVFDDAGSTTLRRKFFNAARDAVIGLRKKQGKNVSVSEFPGQGTIINVDRKVGTPTSECYTAPSVTLSSIELNTGCYPNGFCAPGCIPAQRFADIGLNGTFPDTFFNGKLCDTCVYFFRPTVIHVDSYHCDNPDCNNGTGCDGSPCGSGDLQVDIEISRIASTWYARVAIIGGSMCPSGNCTDYPSVVMELFYNEQPYSGTPTDPVTFTNDFSAFDTGCMATLRSNVFMDTIASCCTEGCGAAYYLAAGKNGTVTFTP